MDRETNLLRTWSKSKSRGLVKTPCSEATLRPVFGEVIGGTISRISRGGLGSGSGVGTLNDRNKRIDRESSDSRGTFDVQRKK